MEPSSYGCCWVEEGMLKGCIGVGAGRREQNLNWEIPVDYYSCLH